uniref:Dehydrogenase/reductase SDR family member 13 n=1 Tax=Macrostomum lignano TaxID=282301 RepID=A0A1I8J502_9PLAT
MSLLLLWELINQHKTVIMCLGFTGASLVFLRRWFAGGRAAIEAAPQRSCRLVLITGASSGIGLAAAREIVRLRLARVCIACRRPELGAIVAADIRRELGADETDIFAAEEPLDLASLACVRRFAEAFCWRHRRLHVLLNNAGIMACPEALTEDGFESQLAVNHLGHFLLTRLLLGPLRRANGARVVTVSSKAHEWGSICWDNLNLSGGKYTPFKAYSQSKLANVLFTRALASKFEARGDDVTAYCLHPGAVQTNLGRYQPAYFLAVFSAVSWLMLKRPVEGAQTSLHCAFAPIERLQNGGYYSDCQLTKPSKRAQSDSDAARLWLISEKLVGLEPDSFDTDDCVSEAIGDDCDY